MQIPRSVNLKPFFNLNADNKTERKSLYLGDGQRKPLENLWPKSSGQSGSSSRKAAAAAKIAELKMRLEAMLKFAGIGKGNPAAAISLAKELAAAVRAYGGGSSGGDSAVSMPQLNVSASSATDSNGAAAQTDSTAVAVGDATSSAVVAAAASTAASVMSATNKGGETSSASDDVKAASAAAAQTATSPSVKLNSANGLSAADSQFLTEAKSLMQQIKMLIKLETKKAEDEKKAQAATHEMTKALEDAPAAIAQSNLSEAHTEYTATGESVAGATETSTVSISV